MAFVGYKKLSVPVMLVVAFLCASTSVVLSQARVALVIGNNAYVKAAPLFNAVNDAASISQELQKSGFQVIRVIDGKLSEINEAKRRFIAAVADGGIGVFYFSGHGIQVEGRNYLLPVDFSNLSNTGFVQDSLSVPEFLDELERARPKLSVLILDACRDNPFSKAPTQAATRGLTELARPIPSGTLVLYAASSNQAALDSVPNQQSKNGLFTSELLAAMRQPGLEIRELAQKVRYVVMEKAQSVRHLQVPALYDNLSPGAFYLAKPPAPAASAQGQLPAQIKVVIPFAERGPSDAVVRAIVPFLSRTLNRAVTVENIIDVQGDKVTQLLARSQKDGGVLLVSPFAASARRLQAADPRLVPIGILADTPLSVIVNEKIKARNLPELLAFAKAGRPLRMAVPLKGSPAEMCGLQLRAKFGANLVQLSTFPGEANAVAEVISGRADVTCAATGAIRSMAARPNAGFREIVEIRSSGSPLARNDVVASSGHQGFDIIAPNWLGLFAPAGTNSAARQELSAALAKIQGDPAFAQTMARLHAFPVSSYQASSNGLIESLRLALSLQR